MEIQGSYFPNIVSLLFQLQLSFHNRFIESAENTKSNGEECAFGTASSTPGPTRSSQSLMHSLFVKVEILLLIYVVEALGHNTFHP